MDLISIFAGVSFIFTALAYIPYVQGVLNSKTRPTISSWISWGLMDSAVLAGMIAQDEVAFQMVAYVIGTAAVIIVSFYKNAALGWRTLDTICVGIVATAIAGWAYTGNPDTGIVLSLVAAIVGSVPLFINTWKDPHNEAMLPWAIMSIGGIFGVLAIHNWTIAGAATQLVFMTLQFGFVVLIARKYHTLRTA